MLEHHSPAHGPESAAAGRSVFRAACWISLPLLVVEVLVASSGLLPDPTALALNKVWEVTASVAALIAWTCSARRSRGNGRRWRSWMAIAMAVFLVGLSTWAWSQVIGAMPLPTATLGPAGFLLTPVLMLVGVILLAFGRGPEAASPLGGRNHAVRLLDLLIITSSALLFVSVTLGESLVRSWESDGPVRTVLAAHPLAYLALAAGIVMLARLRRGVRELPVLFVALAAVSYVVASTMFAQAVQLGVPSVPPWLEAGFMACPVFFLLAAVAPSGATPEETRPRTNARDVAQLAVPYLPLIATTVFVLAGLTAGLLLSYQQQALYLVLMLLVILRQIVTLAENTQLLRRAQYEALHDPLTGLANRTLFLHRLENSLAQRAGAGHPLALAFCDMDDFKGINDTFGHAVGDMVLQCTARRLERCVQGGDVVARLGGDEFAVLLHDVHEPLEVVGDRLRRAVQEPRDIRGGPAAACASVGIVALTEETAVLDTDGLLSRADSAMYEAKRRGKSDLARVGGDEKG